MKPIVPIDKLGRAPEQGRIRYGIKAKSASGKEIPKSISRFRFTSPDFVALKQISELYGGSVEPWDREQGEVITTVKEIGVILPPDPLSQHYELWKGATCVRRCDGETAVIPVNTPDGAELVDSPCVCTAKDQMECKATTRLRVILPEVRFAGVWRLDCKGWHGAQELPSMVSTVEAIQGRGMYRAYLALEQRNKAGKKWIVPVLRLDDSVNALLEKRGGELESGGVPTKELGSG